MFLRKGKDLVLEVTNESKVVNECSIARVPSYIAILLASKLPLDLCPEIVYIAL